jgi:hypothetical protein
MDQRVALETAGDVYGVSIDSETFELDASQTEKLRRLIKAARLKSAQASSLRG